MDKAITTKKAWIAGGIMILLFVLLLLYQEQQGAKVVDMRGKLPTDPNKQLYTRTLEQVQYLAIHHTAGAPQSLYYYANLHISKGFGAMSYGEIVYPDGTVYVCHDPTTITAHNENNNTISYGICVVGNFKNGKPTDAQLKALHQRIKFNQKRFPNLKGVKGHGEFKATACPGDYLQQHIAKYQRA